MVDYMSWHNGGVHGTVYAQIWGLAYILSDDPIEPDTSPPPNFTSNDSAPRKYLDGSKRYCERAHRGPDSQGFLYRSKPWIRVTKYWGP